MKKNVADMVRNYIRRLSDPEFNFLCSRLRHRCSGDLGDAISFMEKNSEINRWLETAQNANENYDMIDFITQHIENDHRSSNVS